MEQECPVIGRQVEWRQWPLRAEKQTCEPCDWPKEYTEEIFSVCCGDKTLKQSLALSKSWKDTDEIIGRARYGEFAEEEFQREKAQ